MIELLPCHINVVVKVMLKIDELRVDLTFCKVRCRVDLTNRMCCCDSSTTGGGVGICRAFTSRYALGAPVVLAC